MKNLLASRTTLKKVVTGTVLTVMGSFVLTGCSSTNGNYTTQNPSNQGYANQGYKNNLVFPRLESAWQKSGQFPNIENLSKIKPGLDKDELYYLIGRPHFSEGIIGVREWDYIMKFYRQDKSVKVCQYKILFDGSYKVHSDYWMPADCANYAVPKIQERIIIQQQPIQVPVIQQQQVPVYQPQVKVVREKLTLDADTLFVFNKATISNMLPKGRIELDNIVNKLRQFKSQGEIKVYITGHTDYKGTHEYNYDLSNRRANTVLGYLASNGIERSVMSATGAGEDFPIKECSKRLPRNTEIACLQPNRRVEIEVVIRKQTRTVIPPMVNTVQVQPQIKNARYVQPATNVTYVNNPAYQQPQQQQVMYVQNGQRLNQASNAYLSAPNVNYSTPASYTTNPGVVYMQQGQPQQQIRQPVYIQR